MSVLVSELMAHGVVVRGLAHPLAIEVVRAVQSPRRAIPTPCNPHAVQSPRRAVHQPQFPSTVSTCWWREWCVHQPQFHCVNMLVEEGEQYKLFGAVPVTPYPLSHAHAPYAPYAPYAPNSHIHCVNMLVEEGVLAFHDISVLVEQGEQYKVFGAVPVTPYPLSHAHAPICPKLPYPQFHDTNLLVEQGERAVQGVRSGACQSPPANTYNALAHREAATFHDISVLVEQGEQYKGEQYKVFGAVPVTPANTYKVLANKEAALLFPGGVREALKNRLVPVTPANTYKVLANKEAALLFPGGVREALKKKRVVVGLEGVPACERPLLFVGNHQTLAPEMSVLVSELMAHGVVVRGLAHPLAIEMFHDINMLVEQGEQYKVFGAVPVTPANTYKVLANKEAALLFPGGVREALKNRGENYQLFWPERAEFVRMAAKHEATIIPFACIGVDDGFDILVDADEMPNVPIIGPMAVEGVQAWPRVRDAAAAGAAAEQFIPPVVVPKGLNRLYFLFGAPIRTKGEQNVWESFCTDAAAARAAAEQFIPPVVVPKGLNRLYFLFQAPIRTKGEWNVWESFCTDAAAAEQFIPPVVVPKGLNRLYFLFQAPIRTKGEKNVWESLCRDATAAREAAEQFKPRVSSVVVVVIQGAVIVAVTQGAAAAQFIPSVVTAEGLNCLYFLFQAPIRTKGEWNVLWALKCASVCGGMSHLLTDKAAAAELYAHVKGEVEGGLQYLLRKRKEDPYNDPVARLLYEATWGGEKQAPTFKP
ncbi:unnamed protein product [Closterium sp. Naga37s-1]|nr:unnamed protein product [Closterium sp. Naga37s-1]